MIFLDNGRQECRSSLPAVAKDKYHIIMKRYFSLIVCVLFFAGMYGCKKHKTYPKVPAPQWAIDTSGKYPASMTAVVELPPDLSRYKQVQDKLGAFINGECRGIGKRIDLDSASIYFVLIQGTSSEQSKVSFQYYSAHAAALYETDGFLDFTLDGNYGTVDAPEVLYLHRQKQ